MQYGRKTLRYISIRASKFCNKKQNHFLIDSNTNNEFSLNQDRFIVIFRHIWNMERKSTQMVRFFARCLPSALTFLNNVAFTFGKTFRNPQRFVWSCRMQFWQPWRIFFVISPKIFRSKSENNNKIIFFSQKILFLKKYSSKKQHFYKKRFHPFKRHL